MMPQGYMDQNPDVYTLTSKVSRQMSKVKCDRGRRQEEGPKGKQERVNSHPWLLISALHGARYSC